MLRNIHCPKGRAGSTAAVDTNPNLMVTATARQFQLQRFTKIE